MDKQTFFRVDENTENIILQLQKEKGFKSKNKAIKYMIASYYANEELKKEIKSIHHDLMLQRKYINELRKNEFLILHLLNTITYASNIDLPVNHNSKDLQSIAFQNALHNYREYITEIQTKIAENSKSIDELGELTDE